MTRINKKAPSLRGFSQNETRQRPTLPPRLQGSTIGAGGLNFRVRNGNGCDPSAIVTWFLQVKITPKDNTEISLSHN